MTENYKFEILLKNSDFAEAFDVFMCNEYSLPSFAIKFLKENSKSFEAYEDDIYVISYPKTGTTWLQELVYLVHSNLDFENATKMNLHQRFPYVEHAETNYEFVKNMPSPRLLKTHLPYSLLPEDIKKKGCKILYITRNPRDVAVSYFHFAKMLKETQYKGNFEQFFERFISNRATYSPFFLHNLEVWEKRNQENILFLFYEDLQNDIKQNLEKIAKFLNRNFEADDIQSIIDHCSFTNMAKSELANKNDATAITQDNSFFRKGQVGDWKNYFTEEMIARLDKKENDVLKDCGLKYTYE